MSPQFIKSPQDLVTTHQSTRQGFLEQALKKAEVANTYVDQAYRLQERLHEAGNPQEAIDTQDIQEQLIAAAGFSGKAANYFSAAELKSALLTVLETIHEHDRVRWRDAVLYRFLLTRGDSLGGSMRNITGSTATSKFAQAVMDILEERDMAPLATYSPRNPEKIQCVSWEHRVLHFDKTPTFIRKNIDVILLRNLSNDRTNAQGIHRRDDYIACGELKGGIDPAGADEHWKTATSALDRIREAFPADGLALFFVGAAIEAAMATEIFSQLQSGKLAFAANFNAPDQLSHLVTWLTSL